MPEFEDWHELAARFDAKLADGDELVETLTAAAQAGLAMIRANGGSEELTESEISGLVALAVGEPNSPAESRTLSFFGSIGDYIDLCDAGILPTIQADGTYPVVDRD